MSFDNYAKNWDTDVRIDRAKAIALEIGSAVDTSIIGDVMEFGCGTGLVSFNLLDRFNNISLIDSSKGMIDVLNQKISNHKVSSMNAYQLDLTDRGMDRKYNAIYNSLVLHHIVNTKEIIRKFYELLNEKGDLCIVDLNEEDGSFHKKYPDFDGHNGFDQLKLKKILVDTGFKDVESYTFYNAEKLIKGEKISYSLFIMKARKY